MTIADQLLDVTSESYSLQARTPDAQRFANGWRQQAFWQDLAQRLNPLSRFPSPVSGIYRSSFQIERDMQIRAAIDGLEVIASHDRKAYLTSVQSGLFGRCEWQDDPYETLGLGVSVLLSDIGRGGCLETLHLVVLLANELGESVREQLVVGLGGPSAATLGMSSLPFALNDPARLGESGEPQVIDAMLFYGVLLAIHQEQVGQADERIRALFASSAPLLGSTYAAWQFLPLLSWGSEFAQEHGLNTRQSALLVPLGVPALQIRNLFWNPVTGVVSKEAANEVAAIEASSPAEQVIMTIANKGWTRGATHREFSQAYLASHVTEFLRTDLEPRHFQNLYKLGLQTTLMLTHKDMDEATRESFLSMDLGL
ncbi:hypothetical protein [Pseudomonas sp. S1(2024)]|uniref:hypothetical protein n=1 Tax=Pseudomonas sp. S1(2024) TaxID=3390191 RepID=UPI00397979CA